MVEMHTPEDIVRISKGLQKTADNIDHELSALAGGKPVGFSLLVWTDGRTQYVSNCDREQIKLAMRELLARWDADDEGPAHLLSEHRKPPKRND